MRKWIWMPVVLFLLLSAANTFCLSGPVEDAVTEEEYGIYRLVLKTPGVPSPVDDKTLGGIRAGADWLNPPMGIQLPPDIVKDFNKKNSKSCKLSEAFVHEMRQDAGDIGEGRKKTTFSRVGFDRERRHGLLIMGVTFYYPEDVMNEGHYVFLEKKDGRWTIRKKARAWSMRLGPARLFTPLNSEVKRGAHSTGAPSVIRYLISDVRHLSSDFFPFPVSPLLRIPDSHYASVFRHPPSVI